MRAICEQESVTKSVTSARGRFKRIDEGLQWRLSRDPHAGHEVQPGFYMYKQAGLPSVGVPTLTVLYEFDDHTVTIRGIRISEDF